VQSGQGSNSAEDSAEEMTGGAGALIRILRSRIARLCFEAMAEECFLILPQPFVAEQVLRISDHGRQHRTRAVDVGHDVGVAELPNPLGRLFDPAVAQHAGQSSAIGPCAASVCPTARRSASSSRTSMPKAVPPTAVATRPASGPLRSMAAT
jgi:hypothetical protein